ncbi:Uncharacterized protein SCF082_LOCUS10465 [Durusdinium trenchii]|uniref:Isopenicillin N synthase-like Fe(2+) 2OG dioxygenase domain-containing protein n=1 Tax=Durusdinium trenchii TaxID=1381693 RepID=A0ABP0J686_9DINO
MGSPRAELVVVDYADLADESKDLSPLIKAAFGPGTTGVLGIRNVPGFVAAKQRTLSQGYQLAHLDADTLKGLEDERSLFQAGWSHGKEKLGDKPDFLKASFYFNPLTDQPGTEEDRARFPVSFPCNVWPPKEAMPEFEGSCKEVGTIMFGVAGLVSKHIDDFVAKQVPGYHPFLETAMKSTEKAKGRLLYYFPLPESAGGEPPKPDSWIGWHNDSGFLTCLAGDMYIDEATGKQIECPDENAGLYVVGRDGVDYKVKIPPDCMAVQMGECVQVMSGGVVQATPHCVRGASVPGVARVSLPVFVDTHPTYELRVPDGRTRQQVLDLPMPKVPALAKRWTEDGQQFGAFLQKTFEEYYEFTK